MDPYKNALYKQRTHENQALPAVASFFYFHQVKTQVSPDNELLELLASANSNEDLSSYESNFKAFESATHLSQGFKVE